MLHDYIKGRVERSGVREIHPLLHAVRHVAYDATRREKVQRHREGLPVEDRGDTSDFDHVIVASGHFSTPQRAERSTGLEKFPGRVMHSHDFRDANEFAGKDLLDVVGSSYSAEDIGIQCHKYGARSMTFSYRTKPMGFDWPDGVEERPLV